MFLSAILLLWGKQMQTFQLLHKYRPQSNYTRKRGLAITFLCGPVTDNERSYWAGGSKLDIEK